jgi:hypothetical protein
MPNRRGCGHARKELDTARCGIVLTMLVLRVGGEADRTGLHLSKKDGTRIVKPRQVATGDLVGRTVQTA